jgi:endonuclease/exonuclease/phosphatase family metal-dependent hydrolase
VSFWKAGYRPALRIVLAAGAALVVAGVLVHGRTPHGPPPRSPEGALRVVSYNVRAGLGGLEEIAEEIERLSPDVVALQEIERGVARSMQVDQPAFLAERLGMRYAFAASITSRTEGDHGVAVLSCHPLRDEEAVPLPQGGGRWPRVALEVTVDAPAGSFRMVCVHLSRPEGWPLSLTRTRLRQVETVLDHLEAEELPAVVAGDFNAFPISPETLTLRQHLESAWRPWRDGWAPSFELSTVGWPLGAVPIDHVFHDPDWKSRGFWSASPGASDHRPVVADLVPRARRAS